MKRVLSASSTFRFLAICFAGDPTILTIATMPGVRAAVPTQSGANEPSVAIVEISPAEVEGEVGEEIVFQALAKDETGAPMDLEPSTWFAAPWDLGAMNDGTLTLHRTGRVRVGAVMGGKTGYATVYVKPAPIESIEIAPLAGPVVVGGEARLEAVARTSLDDPRENASFTWTSETPSIATIDKGIRSTYASTATNKKTFHTTYAQPAIANPETMFFLGSLIVFLLRRGSCLLRFSWFVDLCCTAVVGIPAPGLRPTRSTESR